MAKALTDEQVARFRAQGFLGPLDLLPREEADLLHRKFVSLEQRMDGQDPSRRFRIKAHLPFPWLCELVAHPRLLDAIEDVIGPDILCWGATFFVKRPGDGQFISWHTDSFFYGTRPNDTLTAWVAFNDSDFDSGCMRFIPGSHIGPPAEHVLVPDPKNMSSNGQTVVDVDESKAVDVVLRAGQFSLHHESVLHSSSPNRSDHIRIGFSIHYCPPTVRETRFDGATAMLLRGRDTHDNWRPDPLPERDLDPACMDMMDSTLKKFQASTDQKVAQGGRS
jgi:hypothetical protein